MAKKITCIKKDNGNHENPYLAITSLTWSEGTSTGTSSRQEMYNAVKNDSRYAYVQDAKGDVAYLMGATSAKGNNYVKTVADETKDDNLLKVKEC